MTTALTNTTKANILAQFQTNVRDVINALPKWRSSAHYFYGNLTVPGYYYFSDDWGGSLPLKAGIGGGGSGGGTGSYVSVTSRYTLYTDYWIDDYSPAESRAYWDSALISTEVSGATSTGTGYYRGALRASVPVYSGKVLLGNDNYYEIYRYDAIPIAAPSSGSGLSVTNSPQTTDLPAANIVASSLETALRNATVELSNVRTFTLKKYYTTTSGTTEYATFSATGNLTDAYRLAYGSTPAGAGYSIAAGQNVSASNLDSYVAALGAALTVHRGSTVAFNEYWCHSSCHSSHSSRTRR